MNNVLPIYFLPVEEILWAFIKTNLDFADQGKRRSQRLDSKSRLKKINSGNWSLVVIQKFFLLKTNWSEKLLSRQVGRTLPDESLDKRHLIIMLTKMKYCKQCYCDLLFMYLIEYLWIFVWYIYISLCVVCRIVVWFCCALCVEVCVVCFVVGAALFRVWFLVTFYVF